MQFNKTLLVFDEVSSTNNYLKENYLKLNNYTYLKTKYQTAGRGQFLKKWESKAGENLLFSILLKDLNVSKLTLIKEAVVNSLLTLLNNYQISANFVLPNDVYVLNKKILGILIETKITNTNLDYLIIGIGLNVNQVSFQETKAISIKQIVEKEINIENLYNEFINIFDRNLRRVLSE